MKPNRIMTKQNQKGQRDGEMKRIASVNKVCKYTKQIFLLPPQSIRASDCPNVSEKMEDGASGVSGGSDVDAMDIDQLKKEKIKMQLKVLKLQEECYTLMLNNLRN